ncbi:DNA-binding response regulator [Sphingomonas sp. ABOLD]|uniref:Two-component system response regulator MprA n=1 Tax=Sphingomonas trueperi TaxID=53317 RepID=A0A7X5XZG3_9SPHN|nr:MULTISPECIES: response regulator transcription factor [Sphingomonas]NJB98229.1 two-component system response regulator MprA [Sphingomonas trueperi]RSV33766.1 DNA-binding response regulator [Sphingomonas sp. ABOLE]RSV36151.1 DNA-binding response regulator [Sphingomonas sp. ABOLD]
MQSPSDPSPAALRILVVEDDAQLSALLVRQLGTLGYTVEAVADGRAAIATLGQAQFDSILLDRLLPAIEGVEVLRRIRAEGVETPVILLTALGLTQERVEGLEAGADDYIVKPFEIDELNARIRAVLRRRSAPAADNATLAAGDVTVSVLRHRVTRAGKPIELQKTELRLLAELVREAGSVLSRKMLIERVWGYDFVPATNIVDVHILKLRQRLEMPGLPDPIATVRGVGYMFRA